VEGLLIRCWISSSPPTVGCWRQQLGGRPGDQVDALVWRAFQRLGRRLPKRLQPPGLPLQARGRHRERPLLNLEPIQNPLLGDPAPTAGFRAQLLA